MSLFGIIMLRKPFIDFVNMIMQFKIWLSLTTINYSSPQVINLMESFSFGTLLTDK